MSDQDEKTRIVQALMALAAKGPWGEISLEALAERAGVSLAVVRQHFDGLVAVLAEFVRGIDADVLAARDASLGNEVPRERLFDILFARLEALAPHRAAIRGLTHAALRDPGLALALNGMTVNAMGWMLAASGISAGGMRGGARAQALALIWTRVMRTFLDDRSPDLAASMAELDKRLREAERVALQANRLEDFLRRPFSFASDRRRRRDVTAADLEPSPTTEPGATEGLTA